MNKTEHNWKKMCTDWKDLKKTTSSFFANCSFMCKSVVLCAHSDIVWLNNSMLQLLSCLCLIWTFLYFSNRNSLRSVKWLQCQLTVQILLSFSSCLSVCVLAETVEIQELLTDHGISVQTMSEVLPIRVLPARILSHVYVKLGKRRFLPDCMSVCSCSSNPCARQETARSWI